MEFCIFISSTKPIDLQFDTWLFESMLSTRGNPIYLHSTVIKRSEETSLVAQFWHLGDRISPRNCIGAFVDINTFVAISVLEILPTRKCKHAPNGFRVFPNPLKKQ